MSKRGFFELYFVSVFIYSLVMGFRFESLSVSTDAMSVFTGEQSTMLFRGSDAFFGFGIWALITVIFGTCSDKIRKNLSEQEWLGLLVFGPIIASISFWLGRNATISWFLAQKSGQTGAIVGITSLVCWFAFCVGLGLYALRMKPEDHP